MSAPLFELWTRTVGRDPGALALVDAATGKRWSRAALLRESLAWARAAGGRAVLGRRRVAMTVPNGAEWFQVFLGLLASGAVPVPIDPSEPPAAQLAAARAVGASFLWSGGGLAPVARAMGSRRARVGANEALVKLTSGSSGAPKALAVTHGQLAADGRHICASMGIASADISLGAIPLGYSYGLGNLVAPLLLQGSPVLCTANALPHGIAAEIARHAPTVFPAVPPLLRALVESDVEPASMASLRLVISAGSPLAPEVAAAFEAKFGMRVHGFYGTSETGGIAFDRTGEATLEGRSVGTPLQGVRLTPARGGRLRVSSRAVVGRGSFLPADRCRVDARGEVVLLGRSDRVVKIAGRRVDLAEIEAALRLVPGVAGAYVHLPPAPRSTLAAAVATHLTAPEVRGHLRSRLAPWKLPGRILSLAAFPCTPRGKTDTAALRQLLEAPRIETSISTFSAARQMSARR